MWSTYDTCILLSGVITAATAALWLTGIPVRTRSGAGLIGASLRSFQDPPIVLIAPLIAPCLPVG